MCQQSFDVFLSYHRADRAEVEALAKMLKKRHVLPWLDKWNLIAGDLWQPEIERALGSCLSCAVLVGKTGVGPWQNEEMRVAIQRRVSQGSFRVIPVLLPGANGHREQLPSFLVASTWVEFNTNIDDTTALGELISGIRGFQRRPRRTQTSARVQWVLVLTATVDEMTKPVVDGIIEHFKALTNDATVTLLKVERGSVVLTFESSPAALDTISAAFHNRDLTDVSGYAIASLEPMFPVAAPPPPTGEGVRTVARDAVSFLVKVGFNHEEIASRIQTNSAAVSRVMAGQGRVSERVASSLRDLAQSVKATLATVFLQNLSVLEACHNTDVQLNEEVRSSLERSLLASLSAGLSSNDSTPVSLPPGVQAVLATIGGTRTGLYLIALNDVSDEKTLRVLGHEIEHLRQRLLKKAKGRPRQVPESEF